MPYKSGRHFLQLPGPTNVPDRVLAAMARPTIDHRGPAFQALTTRLLRDLAEVFKTEQHVFVFPGSGSGGWEAAIANTMSPGDRVLIFDQGFFAGKWADVCRAFDVDVLWAEWDRRTGVTPAGIAKALADGETKSVDALLIVHNETSTGVTTDLRGIREVLDRRAPDALFLVDTVSGLGSTDFQFDEWGVDVAVCGSQKGLMLPPGLSFNAVSERAMERRKSARLPRSYWDWVTARRFNEDGFFPYTPATNLLFGLAEALDMLREEGLDAVFRRHARMAGATRRAAGAWGLETVAVNEGERSSSVTALMVPPEHDADALRSLILDRFDMSLGTGLGDLKGRVFRIGHLGDLNDLTLLGALAGVEMGLSLAGVPTGRGVYRRRWPFYRIQ